MEIYKESYSISYLYHFRDSLGLPLTVLCHTTGKLVQLAKFCVMAIVVSRLRTTCHQPPKTQHQGPLVAAWQRTNSTTSKNTVQTELDLISQTQVSFPTHHLFCLTSAFTSAWQVLVTEGSFTLWPNYPAHTQHWRCDLTAPRWLLTVYLTAAAIVTQTAQSPFCSAAEHFTRWFCKVLMTTD